MTYLWTVAEMVRAMDGRPVGSMPEGVTGISIDSRTLKKGEAFFAIRGDHFDGHDFATAAMAAGAGLLVVAEARLPALGKLKVPMIVVDEVLPALERLGEAARARTEARIIAVTGSVGKTTTKEALRHVLATAGKVHASDASFNNHWGVPLTLARMPADADFGIFEIGMNHAGEIRPLARMVRPNVAIITLIAPAHLGNFRSITDIARAKAEIFEGLVPGGTALINRDDRRFKQLETLARDAGVKTIASFGANRQATFRLLNCRLHDECSCITAKIGGEEVAAKISVPGRHVVQNVLAVLGAASLVGADLAKATLALSSLRAESGRGRRHVLDHPSGRITLIDESYNANPVSMRAAIELLQSVQPSARGRRIAVLGDMLELGKQSARLHAGLAAPLSKSQPDMIFLGGEQMSVLKNALPVEFHVEYRQTVDELLPLVVKAIRAGDVIMVKSSNGTGFSKIVKALITKFPPVKRSDQAA